MADHRMEFSERLAAAMQKAGYEPRPVVLMTQFNSRFHGRSIAFQTASRWLNGLAIPKPDKLIALADWLHMDRGLLGFGEKELRRDSDKQIKERAAAYDADEQLLHAIQTLSGAQRKLVRELVTLLAAAGSKRSG